MAIDRSFLAAHATLAHEGIEERAPSTFFRGRLVSGYPVPGP